MCFWRLKIGSGRPLANQFLVGRSRKRGFLADVSPTNFRLGTNLWTATDLLVPEAVAVQLAPVLPNQIAVGGGGLSSLSLSLAN